jgi:hypothetical protein
MRHSLVVLIAGHPPLFYAMQQRDGVMAKALQKLGAKLDKKESQLARQESFIDADKWINDYGIPAVRIPPHLSSRSSAHPERFPPLAAVCTLGGLGARRS